jgi:cob(I)alamin adenosyltransferase
MPILKKGLLQVYTGPGKGKTTAALGLALRAVGQGNKVSMIQFIKGGWKYGELKAPDFLPGFEIKPMGKGFVGLGGKKPAPEDIALAKETLAECKKVVMAGNHELVILDEINCALSLDLIEASEVLSLINKKPSHVHLVLTGRGALDEIIAAADLVTEMKEVKHPYHEGVKAQKGIEF